MTSTAPEGFPVVAADAVQEQRWRLPGGPDWLAVDEAAVWIRRDDGTVDRIAPSTGEIDLTVELGGEPCQGLGVGLGAVWACAGTDVVRLDPRTGEVVATLPVGKTHSHGHLVTAFGQLWFLTGDGGTLVGVAPRSGEPRTTIPLQARGTDVAVGEADLWVVSHLDRQVLRIDPAGTVAVRPTNVGRPIAVAVTDEVWVGATQERAGSIRTPERSRRRRRSEPVSTAGWPSRRTGSGCGVRSGSWSGCIRTRGGAGSLPTWKAGVNRRRLRLGVDLCIRRRSALPGSDRRP